MILTSVSTPVLAQHFKGELEILVVDYFKQGKSETLYQLIDKNKSYFLTSSNSLNKLQTGDRVVIEGDIIKQQLGQPLIQVKNLRLIAKALSTKGPKIGERHVLALLVDFRDKKASERDTIRDVEDRLYFASNSVRQNYLESSYNQLHFISDSNHDGKADVYQVNLDYPIEETCKPGQWAKDAKNEAIAQGIDLSYYEHFLFVLPRKAKCKWAGLGIVGCNKCKAWVKSARKKTYAHELGHNLGLGHASTDPDNDGVVNSEYGDHSSFMGSGGNPLANALHRMQLGWYDAFPDSLRTIKESGHYHIDALENEPSSSGTQVLIVEKGNIRPYYLSFRRNTDTFILKEKYLNKVNIHRRKAGKMRSLFIHSLDLDDEFIDPESGLKFEVNNISADGADVDVTVGPHCVLKSHPCRLDLNADIVELSGKGNHFYIDVPDNTKKLTITTDETFPTEDIKLLLKYNAIPTKHDNDCLAQTPGNHEMCEITNPVAGRWYIKIYSKKQHDGMVITNMIESS